MSPSVRQPYCGFPPVVPLGADPPRGGHGELITRRPAPPHSHSALTQPPRGHVLIWPIKTRIDVPAGYNVAK